MHQKLGDDVGQGFGRVQPAQVHDHDGPGVGVAKYDVPRPVREGTGPTASTRPTSTRAGVGPGAEEARLEQRGYSPRYALRTWSLS